MRRERVAVVLKRYRVDQSEADVAWEHDYLTRLATTGFPASRPLSILAGRSWLRGDDRVWGALTYLPGRPLLWVDRPDLESAGAFLAAYHDAAWGIPCADERPTRAPLLSLSRLMPWDRLADCRDAGDVRQRLTRAVDELEKGLRTIDLAGLHRIVIHGDCTTDNLIVAGSPPAVVGLIDFGAAYREAWLADVACGLWRSGRPTPSAIDLDARRVVSFVTGYHRHRPLAVPHLRAIPALIAGRGVQLIVRRLRRVPIERAAEAVPAIMPALTETVRRIEWVREHRAALADRLAAIP